MSVLGAKQNTRTPAQEGENKSAVPEHPWGSHVLGQLQAPPIPALAGKEKSQQEFLSVPLQDKANTMPDQTYKVLPGVIWIKLMSKGNCWRCRTTEVVKEPAGTSLGSMLIKSARVCHLNLPFLSIISH